MLGLDFVGVVISHLSSLVLKSRRAVHRGIVLLFVASHLITLRYLTMLFLQALLSAVLSFISHNLAERSSALVTLFIRFFVVSCM